MKYNVKNNLFFVTRNGKLKANFAATLFFGLCVLHQFLLIKRGVIDMSMTLSVFNRCYVIIMGHTIFTGLHLLLLAYLGKLTSLRTDLQ